MILAYIIREHWYIIVLAVAIAGAIMRGIKKE
jgi:hypothetical protein